jgi:hypothetical protein
VCGFAEEKGSRKHLLPYAKARATLRERYWRSLWIRTRIIGRFSSDYGVLKRLGDNSMKIGIIGAGKVGGGLGKLWVRAGHQVLFSSRHPKRLRVLVEEAGPGAYVGDVGDAALFGDVILFSPNFWGVDDALAAAGPLKGKTVIDVTNPVDWNPNGRMVRSLPESTTGAEELAKKLPNARVVAKELEAPGRMNRAGLIGIAQAKRLLNQLTDSIQNEALACHDVDQSTFFVEANASAN